MVETLTPEQLEELCQKWKEILRLQDWDTRTTIVRSRDMTAEGREGEAQMILEGKMAIIRILDPIDYPPDFLWPQDQEETLVHELLHLHFHAMRVPDERSTEEEQAINALARALVRLKRGEQR